MSGRPAYLQVSDDLRSQIRTGKIAPGNLLPSTSEMVKRYGVSTTVVRQAISVLRSEGLVQGHQGKGVFVVEILPSESAEGEAAPSAEFTEIMGHLNAMDKAIQALADRLSEMEAVVHRSRQGSRQAK
ncbi:MAG: winged helix-turn-helix transcriptional regulator [Streptomyces sp.]|nr:winged helix-turn-helix transcriptional regulator [Streptomyces sp.]